jgi:hypothetical protein
MGRQGRAALELVVSWNWYLLGLARNFGGMSALFVQGGEARMTLLYCGISP